MTFQPYIAKQRKFREFEFDFWITTPVAQQWYCMQDQSQPEREWAADHIKPGDTVLDCGSHHGMMTVIFSKLTGPTGRVVAFDPVLHNAHTVRENLKLNNCTNAEARDAGIGERTHLIQVDGVTENVILSHTVASTSESASFIKIAALDDEIPASTKVDFLKIDVEGFELEALRGATRLLQSRPTLVLEIHNFVHQGHVLAEIADILYPLDYEYYFQDEGHHSVDGPFAAFDETRVRNAMNPHVYCVPLPRAEGYQATARSRPRPEAAALPFPPLPAASRAEFAEFTVQPSLPPAAHAPVQAAQDTDWKQRYEAVVNSTSWRATAPLRRIVELIRGR